jgi:2-dehydropantoate 2-reductase
MRVAVMGSGGVGGFFGALLARGGADVTFVARGAHQEAMKKNGLTIEGGPDPFCLPRVSVTGNPDEIGTVDVVMICVKLWDTELALKQIRPLVGRDTMIVSLQNGVLKDVYLKATYDERHVVGGVGYVATRIARPGVIARTGPLQRLLIGEFNGGRSARINSFHSICLAGGINAEVSSDIQREIWEKFVFLVGLSATTSTIGMPIGPIRENPKTRIFLRDIMREVVAVGRARGVSLPEDYADRALDLVDEVSPDMTSSMHHDLERGSPLEIRWLSGGVVELSREKGIDAPLNRAVSDILELRAAGTKNLLN